MSSILSDLSNVILTALFSVSVAVASGSSHGSLVAPPEDSSPRLVYYAFTQSTGQGTCSGVSVGPAQFLTSRHCVEATNNAIHSLTLAGQGSVRITDLHYFDGADVAVVTIDQRIFQNSCTPLMVDPVPNAATLELIRIDQNTGMIREDRLVVEDNNYSVYNPDLSAVLTGVISSKMMSGERTQDGDSGASVFFRDENGVLILSGIIMGLSQKTDSILVEPTSKLKGLIPCSRV